jgi:hypothetical protein
VGREETRFCMDERPVIGPGDGVTRERERNSEGV